MDLVAPPVVFTISYIIIGQINFKLSKAPEGLDKRRELKYFGHTISFIHSTIALIFGLMVYISEGGLDYESPPNEYHKWLLGHSMGYMTYDFLISEYMGLHQFDLRMHHMFTCIGGYTLYLARSGGSIAICNC